MNNRDYKQFAEGEIYHVYNRGVGKMDIFRDHEDFSLLISRLREALHPVESSQTSSAHGARVRNVRKRGERKRFPVGAFTLIAYCLMPNHYHLLVRQNGELPISKLILNVFGGYAKCFNKKYERVGSLFQDQFKAVRIDSDEYLRWISAYIHANPPVAGLSEAGMYPYSSYQEYIKAASARVCDPSIVLAQFDTEDSYVEFVNDAAEQIYLRKDMRNMLIDA